MTPLISRPREKIHLRQMRGRHGDGRHGSHLAHLREESALGHRDKDLVPLELVGVYHQGDQRYLVDPLHLGNVPHPHLGYHLGGGHGHHGNAPPRPIKREKIHDHLKEEDLVRPQGGGKEGVRRDTVGTLLLGGGGENQWRIIGRDQTHLGRGIYDKILILSLYFYGAKLSQINKMKIVQC